MQITNTVTRYITAITTWNEKRLLADPVSIYFGLEHQNKKTPR